MVKIDMSLGRQFNILESSNFYTYLSIIHYCHQSMNLNWREEAEGIPSCQLFFKKCLENQPSILLFWESFWLVILRDYKYELNKNMKEKTFSTFFLALMGDFKRFDCSPYNASICPSMSFRPPCPCNFSGS